MKDVLARIAAKCPERFKYVEGGTMAIHVEFYQFWRGVVLTLALVLVVGLLYWLGITGFDATPLWAGGGR